MATRYVVTWAQNATPVHKPFWRALQAYAAARQAEILVVPGSYRNPTSPWADRHDTLDWWDPELEPYMVRDRRQLCRNLTVHGDVSISPTASRPLTGFEAYSGAHSSIFGHPRVQLHTIPRPFALPRIFTSTGACTQPNYTRSKAGAKAHRHHQYAATVVEVEADGTYHLRQITAGASGHFWDLNTQYRADGSTVEGRPAALVLGDLHAENQTDESFGHLCGVVRQLRPKALVTHDVLDFKAQGHHSRHLWHEPRGLAEDDLKAACGQLATLGTLVPTLYVVGSNHHTHLDRWLRETTPAQSPANAPLWIKLWALYYEGHTEGAFERYWRHVWKAAFPVVKWVNGSLKIRGNECGFHGDEGVNGARPSPTTFARLGAKIVAGHSHCPRILDGFYQVGTSAPLDSFGYRQGQPDPSLNTHCVIYPDGRRTLIHVIDGRFTA